MVQIPGSTIDTARAILGDDPEKVVLCDRFSAYGWVQKKSWCWAHLRRDFQAMIDRDDGGSQREAAFHRQPT